MEVVVGFGTGVGKQVACASSLWFHPWVAVPRKRVSHAHTHRTSHRKWFVSTIGVTIQHLNAW